MSLFSLTGREKFHGIQTPEEALNRLDEVEINRRATMIGAVEYMLDVACLNPEVAKVIRPAFSPEHMNQVAPVVAANVVTGQAMQATVQHTPEQPVATQPQPEQIEHVAPQTVEEAPSAPVEQPSAQPEMDWVDAIAARAQEIHDNRGKFDVAA